MPNWQGRQSPNRPVWDENSDVRPPLAARREVPRIPPPHSNSDSRDRALAEESAIAKGRLEREAARSEHERSETLRDQIHYAAVGGFWCAATVCLFGFVVWALHLLGPEAWHFLSPERISKIESIVTTGSVITLIATYFRHRL
jgi:hypothetical protein